MSAYTVTDAYQDDWSQYGPGGDPDCDYQAMGLSAERQAELERRFRREFIEATGMEP